MINRHVNVFLDKETISGILVKEDDKHIVVKLKSGYNVGIARKRVVSIKELPEEKKLKDSESKIIHQDKSLPKISIIHTGGTIASKVDYETGGAISKFSPEDLLQMFPELKDIANIDSKLFRNMWTDDFRFAHFNLLAKEVKHSLSEHHDLKGIIITMGTDNMHYASAALSFIFENLSIPVVIVGSQRSSDRGSSDAAINLISAVTFIANTSLKGVFICMHENSDDETCNILNGLTARKMHSSRRDAFKSINSAPIARINYFTKEIEYLSEFPESLLNGVGELRLHLFDEGLKIGIIRSHPQMFSSEFNTFDDFDGLIIEGTGLGHFPINDIDEYTKEDIKIRKKIEELCKKIPVVISSVTINGSINMNVYQTGRDMIELGVIGNHNALTTETSFLKLAWLLSYKLDVREYFMKDLRGEIKATEKFL